MPPMLKRFAIGFTAGAMLTLAGCGSFSEANNYNLPDPAANVRPQWIRIDSPQNYPTIVRACVKGDGIYIDQDAANSVEVVPNDGACKR